MTRDEYAERLLLSAMDIIEAVHDRGPDDVMKAIREAHRIPTPHGIDTNTALIIILAAAIDHTAPANRLWDWTRTLHTPGPSLAAS